MFIVLSYIGGTYDNLHILVNEDGKPVSFDTEYDAELYAREACAWDYKIVKL